MVKKAISCVFILLFLLTAFTAIDAKIVPASGYNTSVTWGNLNTYDFNHTEFPKQEMVCYAVSTMFSGNWLSADSYGYYTRPTYVYNALDMVADPYGSVDFAHVFWVGDYNPSATATNLSPYGQLGLFTNVTGSYVWDNEVYQRTTANGESKHYFTFMWTCVNGGLYWTNNVWQNVSAFTWPSPTIIIPIPPYYIFPSNPSTGYGAISGSEMVGMPLAWTGTMSMSTNGYTNPSSGDYTFLGWENTSPFMGNTPSSGYTSTDLEYSYFIYHFYRALTGQHYGNPDSVGEALNYAAKMTFGEIAPKRDYNFDTSILNKGEWWYNSSIGFLYCRLRVLGDGNMILPY